MAQRPRAEIEQLCDELSAVAGEVAESASPLPTLIGAEIRAVRLGGKIEGYQGHVFPGILQMPEYTQELARGHRVSRGLSPELPEIVMAGIDLRRRRAQLIVSSGLGYTAFLREDVCRNQDLWSDAERGSGAPRRQLQSVIKTATSPDNGITVRIVPDAAAASLERPLFNFHAVTVTGEPAGPTVAEEGNCADALLKPDDASAFLEGQQLLLEGAALSVEGSLRFMEQIAATL